MRVRIALPSLMLGLLAGCVSPTEPPTTREERERTAIRDQLEACADIEDAYDRQICMEQARAREASAQQRDGSHRRRHRRSTPAPTDGQFEDRELREAVFGPDNEDD